jgi:hypothetical protein
MPKMFRRLLFFPRVQHCRIWLLCFACRKGFAACNRHTGAGSCKGVLTLTCDATLGVQRDAGQNCVPRCLIKYSFDRHRFAGDRHAAHKQAECIGTNPADRFQAAGRVSESHAIAGDTRYTL